MRGFSRPTLYVMQLLQISVGEPSKLWMQVINAKERAGTLHIYNRKVSEIVARMESAINKWQIYSQHRI